MSDVLLIPLVGPMQSWGTRSRFQMRDTEREPTKSAVIGLLCAALGRDRSEPLEDLTSCRMGVRVDKEGVVRKDYQTAQDVLTAKGGWEDMVSERYYLSDAEFLVGLEGDDRALLEGAHKALSNPVWFLSLGRRSYVPSTPLWLPDGLQRDTDLRSALMSYPLLKKQKKKRPETNGDSGDGRVASERIRMVIESPSPTRTSRMDNPVSFSKRSREYHKRFVTIEFFTPEEGGCCVPV